jgi:hypothetical protein
MASPRVVLWKLVPHPLSDAHAVPNATSLAEACAD